MSAKQSPEKIKKAVLRLCRKIGWGLPGDPYPRGRIILGPIQTEGRSARGEKVTIIIG
jgi:hypothetical protein